LVVSSGRCEKQYVVDDSGILADNEYESLVAPFYLFTFYIIMMDTENDTGGPHQSMCIYLLFFVHASRGPALKKK